MKNHYLFLLLFLLLHGIISVAQPSNLTKAADQLTEKLAHTFQQTQIPGCAVAIVSPEQVLYSNAFGYADKASKKSYTTQTIQNIGSVSKTFIGVALMKAVELGHLNLKDDINQYLPFELVNPHYPTQTITVQHLATHTSGIRDRTGNYATKSYVLDTPLNATKGAPFIMKIFLRKAAKNEQLSMEEYFTNVLTKEGKWYKKKNFHKWAPGTHYAYSNIGAALAAYVLEQATGKSFTDFTQQYILDPVGMQQSGWSYQAVNEEQFSTRYFHNGSIVPKYSLITYPDGGMISSVQDMSQYLMAMMQGYFNESPLLSKASFQQMMANQIEVPEGDRQGIFWDVYGEEGIGDIGHIGSDPGINTFMYFNPELKVGSILFVNIDMEKQLNQQVADMWLLLIEHQKNFTSQ